MVFHCFFCCFFKELEFKELEIHRYSLLDTINEYQWISINEYQWISINEFIDGPSMIIIAGPSMNTSPFFGPFFGPHWAAFGPHGARAAMGTLARSQSSPAVSLKGYGELWMVYLHKQALVRMVYLS